MWYGINATKFGPFGRSAAYSPSSEGGSGYFDGNSSYLSFTGDTNTQLNTGNFCIEFWVKRDIGSGDQVIIDSGGGQVLEVTINSNHTMYFYDGGNIWNTPNQNDKLLWPGMWHHVVITVSDTNYLSICLNGSEIFSANNINRSWTQSTWKIGQWWQGTSYDFKGFLSDVRITKGTTLYGSTFAVPTSPLTVLGSTVFLSAFRNANIWDAAGLANYEAVNAIAPVQVNTTSAKWDSTSMYLGTGSFIRTAEKLLYNLGNSDFTLELWMRWINNGSAQVILDTRSADTATSWSLAVDSSGMVYFYNGTTYKAAGALTSGAWQHVAVTRDNGLLRIFVGGSKLYEGSISSTNNANANLCIGGTAFGSSVRFDGFIDEMRFTRGFSRYSPGGFTPPTAKFLTR